MRTKEKILDDVYESKSSTYRENCILEVLIDIRDQLVELNRTENYGIEVNEKTR